VVAFSQAAGNPEKAGKPDQSHQQFMIQKQIKLDDL
jgi:hypothetical protein